MLRLAMTNHIFAEPKPGVVAHTAASQALALNPLLYAWAGFTVQEIWPGFLKVRQMYKILHVHIKTKRILDDRRHREVAWITGACRDGKILFNFNTPVA